MNTKLKVVSPNWTDPVHGTATDYDQGSHSIQGSKRLAFKGVQCGACCDYRRCYSGEPRLINNEDVGNPNIRGVRFSRL
jgi:hypothetical protein